MATLKQLYGILLDRFGPQGWWPLTVDGMPRHHAGKPKNSNQRFEIVIGAILTQNTNWNNVVKALVNLSSHNLISPVKIINTPKGNLAALIRPSGYYNQKAERLKLAACFFLKNKNPSRSQLLALKGIGPETADSILLYAYGKPYFVIDAYTKRLYSRFYGAGMGFSYEGLRKTFEDSLGKDAEIFHEFHALIVELGKNYCKKAKPLCNECPLGSMCKNKNI